MKKQRIRKALVSSTLALILCVSMFIGNTFAWFTDTASTSVNRIQAGNLDIEVYYATPADLVDGKVPDDAWKKISADESVFDEDALWEPGYTQIVYFKLVNEGSLALKYQLRINIVNEVLGKNKSGEDIQLSNYIQAYVVNSPDQNYLFATRDAALHPQGAPDKFSDTLYNAANLGIDTASNGKDTELSLSSEHVLVSKDDVFYATLVLWMPDTVGNEANHDGVHIPSIDLGINVYATQHTYEYDSNDNQYDAGATYDMPWDGVTTTAPTADESGVYHIKSAAELVWVMNITQSSNEYYTKSYVLDCDIDLGGATVTGFGNASAAFAGNFDGNGFTITNFVINATDRTYYAGLFNYVGVGNVTIKNLTVTNATVSGSGMVGAIVGGAYSNVTVTNCKVYDSTLSGVKKVGAVVGYAQGATVTDNYAENCTIYYSEKEANKILGYEGTDSTVSGNKYTNVEIVARALVSTLDEFTAAVNNTSCTSIVLTDEITNNK